MKLNGLSTSLSQLNPLAVLTRGYAIAIGADGKAVRDAGTLTIGSELQGLSEIKVVGWSNIDQAPELVEIHNAHVAERRRELDSRLNRLVEIDSQIAELSGDAR